jgi:DNA-binding transcriptional ArsR family regulator
MDIAALTLFGRARYQVLATLFSLRDGEGLHLREIARRTDLSPTAVQYELRLLNDAGLVLRDESSGRSLYRIDMTHAIAKDLRTIVRKTSAAATGPPPAAADLVHWAGKRRQQGKDYAASQHGQKSIFLADPAFARSFQVDLTPLDK